MAQWLIYRDGLTNLCPRMALSNGSVFNEYSSLGPTLQAEAPFVFLLDEGGGKKLCINRVKPLKSLQCDYF